MMMDLAIFHSSSGTERGISQAPENRRSKWPTVREGVERYD